MVQFGRFVWFSKSVGVLGSCSLCMCECVYALLATFLCILYIFGLLNGTQLNWVWKCWPYAQIFHHAIKRDMQNATV